MATATRNGKSPDAIGRRLRDECRDLLSAPFPDQRRRLEELERADKPSADQTGQRKHPH
jgi:hypothetical protein